MGTHNYVTVDAGDREVAADVRAALGSRYPSVDAFAGAFPMENRRTIERRLDSEA